MIVNRLKGKRICLSFDDGPDPAYTPRVLDALAAYGIKAMFFVTGQAAERHPELIRRIAREGHTLGNHTYSHAHPRLLSPPLARREVYRTGYILYALTGRFPGWFRPPFGSLTAPMREQSLNDNMRIAMWSRSAVDWGPLATPVGIARRLGAIEGGDIVLMHDGYRRFNKPELTVSLLPSLLESLVKRGLTAVTLDQAVPPAAASYSPTSPLPLSVDS